MELIQLMETLDYEIINGSMDRNITQIAYDSRKIEEGGLFVCLTGMGRDGHDFIPDSISRGAAAVVIEQDILFDAYKEKNITILKVKNTRVALSKMSAAFFDYPEDSLKTIGITGTKGKTTTAFMPVSYTHLDVYKRQLKALEGMMWTGWALRFTRKKD